MLFSKIWRIIKYILLSCLLLLVALVGVGFFSQPTVKASQEKSALIQSLDRTERAHGDVLKILVENLEKVGNGDAKLVTEWLKERQNNGDLPYLYFAGIYSGLQGSHRSKVEGLKYIAKATLVYRIDAARCGDPSANEAVPILESALGINLVRNNLKNNPGIRKKMIQSALEYEEKSNPRPDPQWICIHGMGYGSPAPGEKDWQTHRQKIRTQMDNWF